VVTGAKVDLHALGSASVLGTVLVLTVLAVVGKLLGCGGAAWSLGRKSALIVGMGMVPRGEVGIIIASLGRQAGVFTSEIYAVIIAMSLLTSIVGPPALGALLADKTPEAFPPGREKM
jgi:Kef-type K+ transport system membrane component KefB